MDERERAAETDNSRGFSGKGQYVRVAVVQVEYHPAIIAEMRSPLEDPGGVTFLLPPPDDIPDELRSSFADLRKRIRDQYTRYMTRRVKRILQQCDAWGVRVVVFPEYSIPWQILPAVSKAAPNIVVVAGTHTVQRDSKLMYTQLNWSKEKLPKNGQAVAPVLHDGRLIGLSAKFHPAVAVGEKITPAKSWQPIEMPPGIPGPMGVMVCLDFLYRENKEYRTLVGDQLDKCHFLAIPSLTPARSLDRFENKGWEDVKGYGRPVLYTNDSKEGGATIFVDEKERSDLTPFPEHVGCLVGKDEGVIVADVDLGFKRAGGSGRLDAVDPVKPFAMASLVYPARPAERAYSEWLDALGAIVGDSEDDLEDEQVERFHTHVRDSKGILQAAGTHSGARADRLRKLSARMENITFVEDIRRLTREVVLEPQTLPFGAFCAALARGASREIERWVVKHGQLGAVLSRLREPWDKLEREMATWTQEARLEAANVVQAVAGENVPHDPQGQMPIVAVYEGEVDDRFKEQNDKAREASRAGRFAEARDIYHAMRSKAKELLQRTEPNGLEQRPLLRRWVVRCRLNAALTTMNLQEIESAREQLLSIPLEDLNPTDRMHLSEGLALVGELERARALLPGEETLPEPERELRKTVEQTLDVLDGRLPEQLANSPMLWLRAAPLLLDKGERARVAAYAREIIESRNGDALTVSLAMQYLTEALRRTLIEMPFGVEGAIPAGKEREDIVELLEKQFDQFNLDDLPEPARRPHRSVEVVFRVLMDDADWMAEHGAFMAEPDVPMGDPNHPRNIAYRLAEDGRLDEALRILSSDHPWNSRLDRVGLLVIAKRSEQALEELLVLAKEYEHDPKVSIEYGTAKLLHEAGRIEEALEHARKSFAQLPGIGHRIQLVELLQRNGHAQEAWDLLKGVEAARRPTMLRARAIVAETLGSLTEAESAWRAYIELRPKDGAVRVHFADILFVRHKPEEAAAVAWKAFVEQSDRLDMDELFVCARLQRIAGPLDQEQRRRIKEIAAKVRERFLGDAKAEQLRLQLLSMLGELPDDVEPIDFPKLEEAGYVYKGEGGTELVDYFKNRQALVDEVDRLRRKGAIPIVTACAMGGAPLALVVTRILERSRLATGYLCPPVSLSDQPSAMQLEGATILVSDLELLLLEVLDLIPAMREALGTAGRVLLFERAHARILNDVERLRNDARPDVLQEMDALVRKVERLRAIEPDPSTPFNDAAAARRANGFLLRSRDEPSAANGERIDAACVSPGAFLHFLRDQGIIDEEQYARAMPYFSREPESLPILTNPLSGPLVVPVSVIKILHEIDALDAVFIALREELRVGPRVLPFLRGERADLADTIHAQQLIDRVHARLTEDWIAVVSEPTTPDLPPLRHPSDAGALLVLEPLQEMLTYRVAVRENPNAWRLTAEFYGSVGVGAPEFAKDLAWEPEHYKRIAKQIRDAATRDLTFPALVRYLHRNAQDADALLLKLAELGFPDALGPDEILRLERRYKGLNKSEPKRILDHQEWMAREPGHWGADYAQLRLAQTYAATIFESAFGSDRTITERASMIDALLSRQEDIGNKQQTNTLDLSFAFLAARTAEQWQRAWSDDGENYILDSEGTVGSLWELVSNWSMAQASRRASHHRAIREVGRLMSRAPDGPPEFISETLSLSRPTGAVAAGELSFVAPEIEATAILSSLWKQAPSSIREYQRLFDDGVTMLARESKAIRHPREFRFRVVSKDRPQTISVRLPLEAVFLRLPSDARKSVAPYVKVAQGIYDGIAYKLLEKLEKAPEDVMVLREYADHASCALFRLIRDDPSFLRIWPRARRFGAPQTQNKFDELLDILSEPHEPFAEDLSLNQVLRLRINEGEWRDRDDKSRLFFRASEIPGYLPAVTVVHRLESTSYDSEVCGALTRLDQSDEHPIARIAGDIMFLRVAASQRPHVKLPEGDVDLRDILPSRFLRLLEKVAAPPTPDTLAAAEPALLRVCADVIARLTVSRSLSIKYALWLIYRLFQWLCLQLQDISPDARVQGMRQLVQHAPPPRDGQDLLDPTSLSRERFDHRLATVLHAFGVMAVLTQLFGRDTMANRATSAEESDPSVADISISSTEFEDKLITLAQKAHLGPSPTTVLDWQGPRNVPDLALHCLLHLNPKRFADVPSELRMLQFQKVPDDPQAVPSEWPFLSQLHAATANNAPSLTPEERAFLEAKVRRMVEGPITREWQWLIFVSFFESGADHLQDDAWRLMQGHWKHKDAVVAFGQFVLAISRRDMTRVESTIETALAVATSQGADAVALAVGALARLSVHGTPAGQKLARTLLLQLAERSPFREDPRMVELIGFFGLRKVES